jgi:acetyltransferase-like isoleucine patch superfamily enzyme
MKVWFLDTPRSLWSSHTVFGLGDPIDDALILNLPLSAWRGPDAQRALPGATLQGPALLMGRDLWVSHGMRRDFLKLARALSPSKPVRLVRPAEGPALTCDPLRRLPRPAGRLAFDLWFLPEGCAVALPQDPAALPDVLETDPHPLDVPSRTFSVPVAADEGQAGTDDARASLTVTVAGAAAAPVSHWVELGRANLLAIGAQSLDEPAALGLAKLAWAALRALSLNPFAVLGKINRVGKRCWIHPNATLEACVIGDDVRVDAGAVLRACVIGDKAKVGPLALAEYSVIGPHAELQKQSTTILSVAYPHARLGGILQLGVAGHHARQKMGSVATDMNPNGGEVKVMTPLGLQTTDLGYLGVCLGHHAFVGSGLWIAPGRIIEAHRTLLLPPERIVLK